MLDKIFTEEMTSSEARITLFKAVEGKTKEEIEEIKAAYLKVSKKILEREFELAKDEWMF